MSEAHDWLDAEAGPLVRNYALTGGRARPGATVFDLLTFVAMIGEVDDEAALRLHPEHRAILDRCRDSVSVAELASHVSLPLGVVRVLLNDLLELGAIERHEQRQSNNRFPDDDVLKAVIHGLRTR